MTLPDLPFVSVVIPVRNEEKNIEDCVWRIFSQSYPGDRMEVLIVDGMSTDATRQKISNLDKPPFRLRILDNPKIERAAGLNVGIRQAKGDVILRLDARTRIMNDYVSKCVETLKQTNADNVGGLQLPVGETPTQQAIAMAMTHTFGVGNAQFRIAKKSGYVDTVYLGCFPKAIFERVGLFDEDYSIISEDSDMNLRITRAGGKIFLNPEIKSYYVPRDTLGAFWNLYFRYGEYRAGNFYKHKRLSLRQIVPPAMLAVLFILGVLSFISAYALYLFTAVLLLYISCNILSTLSLTLKARKLQLSPIVFSAFFCMHFGWAFGFYKRLFSREKPGAYFAG